MFIGKKRIESILFVLLNFLVPAWALMLLFGCGGYNENIPPASVLTSGRITLSWNEVAGATFYNVYLSTSAGVSNLTGYKIRNATSPITITDLKPGTTYYFIVAAVGDSGEIAKSMEMSHTVTETEGFIDFNDLMSEPVPESKSFEPVKEQTAAVPEKKPSEKKSEPEFRRDEPELRQVETHRSDDEIIICLGDSLTFGTGADRGMDYPSQLARMIDKPVINAGIPGDTTAGALQRLQRDVLSKNPDIVLITLGGNDLKNGVSKEVAFGNLRKIVESIQKQGATVIIGGLKFPQMDRGFGKGYEALAEQTGAILVPNIFEGIMGNRNLMSDTIHPNNAGYTVIAQRFYEAMATHQSSQTAVDSGSAAQQVTLTWDKVPNAASYNVYWSKSPGVTKRSRNKISSVENSATIKGLEPGTYYFVVTAVNESGESDESKEFSYTIGK